MRGEVDVAAGLSCKRCVALVFENVRVLPGTCERLGILPRPCFMYFQRSAVNLCALECVNLRRSNRWESTWRRTRPGR